MYSQCRRRVTVEEGGAAEGSWRVPNLPQRWCTTYSSPICEKKPPTASWFSCRYLMARALGWQKGVGPGQGGCRRPSAGTPGWLLSHTSREEPRVEPSGTWVAEVQPLVVCSTPVVWRVLTPLVGRPPAPGAMRHRGCRVCATAPGKGGPPGGQGPPSSLARPLTSCSPTRSWFLAEREPEQRVGMSPYLGFQASLLGGAGKLSCLSSSRGRLASFRGPDSHLSMQGRTHAYIPLLRPEAPV